MQTELEQRYEVSSLSRYGLDSLDDAHNFKGNIQNIDSILPAFENQDVVVHLAADRSMKADFASALEHNVIGTQNVYEAARRCGVKRVVYGSSQHAVGGVYLDEPYRSILNGDFDDVKRPYPLVDETIAPRPSGHYGISKVYGEATGAYYADYHGISTIALRIGFTISNDVPTFNGAALALWLSHRDTTQIHIRAIDAPASVKYTVLYAMSDNYWSIFSLDQARDVIGYQPQDDAGEAIDPNASQPERDLTEFKLHPEG